MEMPVVCECGNKNIYARFSVEGSLVIEPCQDCIDAAVLAAKVDIPDEHCTDCCCSQSWAALGITEYTGKSIPERIAELRKQIPEDVEPGLNYWPEI